MKNDTASDNARILLIEDNIADVDLMKYALNKAHFRCEVCALRDGAEALAFIRKQGKYAHAARPDLIVLDLHLPKNDGMEVLGEIRRTPGFANLQVAVLSSSVSPEDRSSVAAFKRTCFIAKPLDLDGFMTVAKTIERLSLEGKGRAATATAS